MRKQHAPKATLFLMELVIVIFFFSICAAICVNVFGSAQQMAVNSDALSRAAMEARSAASCYKAAEGNLQETARLLDGEVEDCGCCVTIAYDKTWQKADTLVENGYIMELSSCDETKTSEVNIRVMHADAYATEASTIFSIAVKTHADITIPNNLGEGSTRETDG